MIGYLWITAATEKKVKYANFVYIYVKINTEIEKKLSISFYYKLVSLVWLAILSYSLSPM